MSKKFLTENDENFPNIATTACGVIPENFLHERQPTNDAHVFKLKNMSTSWDILNLILR